LPRFDLELLARGRSGVVLDTLAVAPWLGLERRSPSGFSSSFLSFLRFFFELFSSFFFLSDAGVLRRHVGVSPN
jgi:hypothetical protein